MSDVSPRAHKFAISLLFLAIVLLAVLRSSLATRLDSFTMDENYHITAGVSYLRTGDYRINPEHPPLVKLWVGAFMPRSFFTLPPLQVFNDKVGERIYAAQTVFLKNDADRIQARARIAMFLFNGLALLLLALLARRIFGNIIALGALLYLAIDPTVAAHMPVVMTDLPITLLGSVALLTAWLAFTTWSPRYLAFVSIALGLALATKHSGLIFAFVIAVFALIMSLRKAPVPTATANVVFPSRPRRLLLTALALAGSVVVLWSTYRFHYNENPSGQESFNRPLKDKILDLDAPRHRFLLNAMTKFHLAPRAFIWGFADVIRGGVEGRAYPVFFMDRVFVEDKPRYFFPVQVAIKTPLGLLILALTGLAFFFTRKISTDLRAPFWFCFVFTGFFFLTLSVSNSFYAGVRHALPVYPALALFAGAALLAALQLKSLPLKALVAMATTWAAISAITVLRPWEYHNALAGGTANAYLHYSDEGIDLTLRTKELASYYHRVLEPKGEIPYYVGYFPIDEELQYRGVKTMQYLWGKGLLPDDSDDINGSFFADAITITPAEMFGTAPMRQVQPAERFGNLLLFRGRFHLPVYHAMRLYYQGIPALYEPNGGPDAAFRLFEKCSQLNPTFYPAWIEIGNLQMQWGHRQEALEAYQKALLNSPPTALFRKSLEDQIQQVRSQPDIRKLHVVRDPFLE